MRRLTLLPFMLLAVFALAGWRPAAPPAPIVKGVALLDWSHKSDLVTLNSPQHYGWGAYCNGAPDCLNMNRNWTLPQATCYDMLLLGNEPTNLEPAGHPITPTLAVSVTIAIEVTCPNTLLVVGNIHLNNRVTVGGDWNRDAAIAEAYQWLEDYLEIYATHSGHRFNHILGVHCYGQYSAECMARLVALKDLDFGGKFWLTEFGIYGDEPYVDSGAALALFLKELPFALPNRIDRVYIWTNRSSSCCSGWPFELVNGDGTLTPMGVVYANWQPPTIRQTYLPVASNKMIQGYP